MYDPQKPDALRVNCRAKRFHKFPRSPESAARFMSREVPLWRPRVVSTVISSVFGFPERDLAAGTMARLATPPMRGARDIAATEDADDRRSIRKVDNRRRGPELVGCGGCDICDIR